MFKYKISSSGYVLYRARKNYVETENTITALMVYV